MSVYVGGHNQDYVHLIETVILILKTHAQFIINSYNQIKKKSEPLLTLFKHLLY